MKTTTKLPIRILLVTCVLVVDHFTPKVAWVSFYRHTDE